MAATQTSIGYGSSLKLEAVVVAEVYEINGPSIEGSDVEATHMDSPSGYREYIPGLLDPGAVDITLNYTKAQCAALIAVFRQKKNWTITYPDASTWTFTGYLNAFGPSDPVDDRMTIAVTIKLAGAPTFTQGA